MLIIQEVGQLIPHRAGKVISMCSYHDKLVIVTEYGELFELADDGFGNYRLREQLVSRVNELEKKKKNQAARDALG